jgi:hypothetical protein
MRYPAHQLQEEIAFVAMNFHWPLEQLLDLEHGDRRRWVVEIQRMLKGG